MYLKLKLQARIRVMKMWISKSKRLLTRAAHWDLDILFNLVHAMQQNYISKVLSLALPIVPLSSFLSNHITLTVSTHRGTNND